MDEQKTKELTTGALGEKRAKFPQAAPEF